MSRASALCRRKPPPIRFRSRCGGGEAAGRRDLQHAHVLFLRDHVDRIRRVARGDQHFEKLRRHRLERRRVDGPVEGDDAAEGRNGVGRERIPVGRERALPMPRRTDSRA
jgi:hypothetical protein